MTIKAYWWCPRNDLRAAASQRGKLRRAWCNLRHYEGRMLTNFGDELSRLVLQEVTGQRVTWASRSSADVFAVGSIMDQALRGKADSLIWGSGVRNRPAYNIDEISSLKNRIVAIRGPKSAAEMGLSEETISIGDPGLVSREFSLGRSGPNGGTVIVPHFSHFGNAVSLGLMKDFANQHGARILAPHLPPLDMIREISRADLVFSASLHGIIVSHARRIPVVPIRIGVGSESDFKYEDYYASIGENWRSWDLSTIINLSSLNEIRNESLSLADRIDSRVDKMVNGLVDTAKVLR